MDISALAQDKKVWIVAGGAGLVGLVVFLKRGGATASSTPAATSAASGVPAGGQMVTADTTSTDIASYLSQVSQQNQDQFNQWGKNLTDTLTAVQGMTANSQTVYSAGAGQSLADLASASGLTEAQLFALNPNLGNYLKDADNYGFISPSNPANREGATPVGKVFWTSAPVKTK